MLLAGLLWYFAIGLSVAANIFFGVALTGTRQDDAITRALSRAVVGFFWPYLALLLVRWIFLGGNYYEKTVLFDGNTRRCTVRLTSPTDLFSYFGWNFYVTRV